MKLRHAALLALAGWYLMLAPSMGEGFFCGTSYLAYLSHRVFGTGDLKTCKWASRIADDNAPMSAWHVASPYESLEACQKARDESVLDPQRPWPAQCVATDDPFLKP